MSCDFVAYSSFFFSPVFSSQAYSDLLAEVQRLRKQLNTSNDSKTAHKNESAATASINSTHLRTTDMRKLTERLSSHVSPRMKISFANHLHANLKGEAGDRKITENKIPQDTTPNNTLNNFRGDPGTVLSQKPSDTRERKPENKKHRKDGEF